MIQYLDIFITTLIPALVGLVVWTVKETRKTRLETQEALEAAQGETMRKIAETLELVRTSSEETRKATKISLRTQMNGLHTNAIDRRWITTKDKQAYLEAHYMYLQLGGNGVTSHLLSEIERVELVVETPAGKVS